MSLLLALAMQIASDPVTARQDEIVVIGQKQKNWRGNLKHKKGVPFCKTTRSTGDKEIDKIGCDAMIICFPIHGSSLMKLAKQYKKKSEFNAAAKPIYAEMGNCVFKNRDQGISELADKRLGIVQ
ncbi:hypothetical protein [Sphingorhabdus sp.]|jgi:hypothetical protein|uniref:hypothetical protein n=1 Tax=Sphingorhabdus sp. TaxID=1902408 RepID=UPI0037CBEE79